MKMTVPQEPRQGAAKGLKGHPGSPLAMLTGHFALKPPGRCETIEIP